MGRILPLIVVDGPAASGKSTLARRLAYRLGLPFVSTGAMYRAVTWLALRRGIDLGNEAALARLARKMRIRFVTRERGRILRILVDGTDATESLDSPDVARYTSSRIAMRESVRTAIVERTRRLLGPRGLVAEGRDCGSVIFPRAPYKFFITSLPEERARRRYQDLYRAGAKVSYRRLLADMRRRDREDRTRPRGALVAVPDAWVVDNTNLVQEQTLEIMEALTRGVMV